MSPVFRRRDKRPKVKSPDDVMKLPEHLGELRVRIIRCALAITIAAIVVIAFYNQVLNFLTKPYIDLCKRRGPEVCGFVPNVPGLHQLYIFDPMDGLAPRLR